jgi:hypothetical protein
LDDGALGNRRHRHFHLPTPIQVAEFRSFDYAVTERAAGLQEVAVACSTLVIWETFAHSAIDFWSPGRLQPACIGDFLALGRQSTSNHHVCAKHRPDFAEKGFSVPSQW